MPGDSSPHREQTLKTILVTGGAGFIGSHICDRLAERGHTIVAADNLMLGRREHIQPLENRPNFTFVEMDVSDIAALGTLAERHRFDCVFHFAANSDIGRSHADPGIDLTHTFATTYSVLEAMRLHGIRELVFASTSAVYGEAKGALAEDHGPLLPISHYGAGKLASEGFISSYGENYGIQSWIPRFPNVVGDRATHGALFDWGRKLTKTPDRLEVLGDGTQVKPYLHVSDLVSAILMGWDRLDKRVNVFNVGGTTRATVRRMAEIFVEEAGGTAAIHYTGGDRGWIGDVPSVEYDTTRIRSIGWEPRYSSEEAVRAAARWIIENPS